MKEYIGILGGGQLAKMLCESAKKIGYKTIVLDCDKDACGGKVATKHYADNYLDEKILKKICDESEVITYEFENIPVETIEYIEKNGNIPQGKRPIYISKNRIREKNKIKKLGIKTAEFVEVENKSNLIKGIEKLGCPLILKTCEEGYDGKGQWKINSIEDIDLIQLEEKKYILEKKIDFQKEVSCMVIRGVNGEIVTFPIGENIHKNGILNMTIVPARIDKELEEEIKYISKKIMEELNFYGPLGIEFFIKDKEIYFNEMAPRPHNSVHYTMDACNESQFDLHLKSLLGKSLEEPKLLKKVVMLNILGEDKEKVEKIKIEESIKVYLYGKSIWKIGRKMGHINFLGDNLEELIEKAKSF